MSSFLFQLRMFYFILTKNKNYIFYSFCYPFFPPPSIRCFAFSFFFFLLSFPTLIPLMFACPRHEFSPTSFVMSVRLSACVNADRAGQIFVKFGKVNFYEIVQICLK